ncbi:capsular polysaccharide synthesis protein [Actinoplanes sp. NPDC023801]|uniref:capsular polysaccharide synthesis protein n=1 Tax=Actinoplanes sp. NPDC023801 TaxID=3154595 RepID=UPI0033D7C902
MTANAPDDWLARFRAAIRRTPPPPNEPAPVPPADGELAADPGFRDAPENIDVPATVTAERVEVPGRPGVSGLSVTGAGADSGIAPPARPLRPGVTYRAEVSVHLAEPLNAPILRVIPEWVVDEPADRAAIRSMPARNEYGHHRISLTFTVPAGARDALVRLHSGEGTAIWYDYSLTTVVTPAETVRPEDDDPLAAGRAALAAGDVPTAVKALRQVVKAGDPDGEAAWELGRIELAEQRWAAAEQLLRGAVAKQPEAYERGYALALAYDRLKRRDDSRRASAAALIHDTKLPFDGAALLDSDVTSFGARREVGIFLAEHLPQIRTQAGQRLARPVHSTFDQPIFVYWAQGFEVAPPVVRACLAALKATNPDSRVHELSLATIGNYVDMPEDLVASLAGDHYHFSDLLRMLLLEKFGGIWVDATCLVTEPLRSHVDRALARGSVFAFNYTGPYLVNWFLASRPDSYVMHLWRAASFLWWEKRGEIVDFLLHHHIFEMLHRLDDRFRAEWDAGLRLNATPPHALQSVLLKPYEPEMFQTIMESSFVHKLRHSLPADPPDSESYLSRIIRGDH